MTEKSAIPPLGGLKVLDFSTLLPGPMASLILSDAGASVVKVERPGSGDEMRGYPVAFGEASVNFAMLNRGKSSLCVDLKDPGGREVLLPYLEAADVVIEQFRPGVMDRLGLGFEDIRRINPRVVYCSITGYGQDGARRNRAGHDLNYLAETGVLGLSRGADGAPVLPPILAADIAGGAYPAVINILLALRQRDADGQARHIDVAMADNLFAFAYWGLGAGFAAGAWPRPGGELVTGGSPRYRIYRTADNRFLAVAALEEKFWRTFCETIGLPPENWDDREDPQAVGDAIAALLAQHTADHWEATLQGLDVCVSVVTSLEEAAADQAFAARGIFAHRVVHGARSVPALFTPVASGQRSSAPSLGYPALGAVADHFPWK